MSFTITSASRTVQHVAVLLAALTVITFVKDASAKPASKIVNGDFTTIEEFPSAVSIKFAKNHRCGGTLITNKHVLTAAHCVVFQFPNSRRYNVILKKELEVYIGTNSSSSLDDKYRHHVENVDIHADYTGDKTDIIKHDIAVITLAEPIEPTRSQGFIKLAPSNPSKGTIGYIVGWGFTSEKGALSENLKKLKVVVQNKLACSASQGEFCASRNKNEGPSNADSGGPLYIDNYLAGIIVRTYGSQSESADIFTSVFDYRTWIHRIIFNL